MKSFSAECWFSGYEATHYEKDLGDGYTLVVDIPRSYSDDFIDSSEPVWVRIYYLGGLYIEHIFQYLGGGRWYNEFRTGERYVTSWSQSYQRSYEDFYWIYNKDVSSCKSQQGASGYFMYKFDITFKEYELPPAERLPIHEDFEGYSVGVFPHKWSLVWNGQGNQYQKVVEQYSYDGSKCLQLWGRDGWSAVAERKFMPMEDVIALEGAVMVSAVPTNGKLACRFGFWNRDLDTWGKYFHEFHFHADRKIYCRPDGWSGVYWSPYEWYKCKIVLDRANMTADYYINDELVMEDVKCNRSDLANGIVLVSDHGSVKCFFDSISLYKFVEEYDIYMDGNYIGKTQNKTITIDGVPYGEHTFMAKNSKTGETTVFVDRNMEIVITVGGE